MRADREREELAGADAVSHDGGGRGADPHRRRGHRPRLAIRPSCRHERHTAGPCALSLLLLLLLFFVYLCDVLWFEKWGGGFALRCNER